MKKIINVLKRKTKYGFTLIELISVIIIIGVIALISVPITINVTNNAKNKAYKEIIDSIELSAYNYSVYNDLGYNRLYKALQVSTIKLAGYLDNEDIIDPRDNSTIDGCVMYRYMPSTENYEFRYTGSCTEQDFYPEIKINVLNDNNKEWLNEKIKFTISGEYDEFKYCIGKNECNPDIYYHGETTLDTEGINLVICATGYFGEEVGNSTCTKLYNIDYTKPDIIYTTKVTTNKITISASCNDSLSGVKEILYSLDGGVYGQSNIFLNIKEGTHVVKVKCIDNALNEIEQSKNITPPKIVNPTIMQVNQSPSGTWAQNRVVKITYDNTNIETPYYYFRSQVRAIVSSGVVVESCGTKTTPETCIKSNITELAANTWYRTNNKEILLTYKENIVENNKILYAITYDGTNFSSSSTHTIGLIDVTKSNITINVNNIKTDRVTLILTCKDSESGITKYEYSKDNGTTWVTGSNSYTFTGLTQGTNYKYAGRCTNGSGLTNTVSSENSTYTITNPVITQISQTPSSGTWAQNRMIRITYNNSNIETPKYEYLIMSEDGKTIIQNWTAVKNTTIDIRFDVNRIVYARTTDGTNTVSTSAYSVTNIDTTKPKINFEITGTIGNNEWYISNVVGKITSTNAVPSGVTYYYGQTKTPTTQGSIFTHTSDGTNIEYCTKAISGSGVQSEVVCKTFKRDAGIPSKTTVGLFDETTSTTYTSGNWTNKDVIHYVAATDEISGLDYFEYSHDGINWGKIPNWQSSWLNSNLFTYIISWEGQWNFYIRAVDKAGNRGAASDMFTVRIIRDLCSSTKYVDTNGSWGSCSADCGGGTQSYTVTRTYYSTYTGQYCSQEQVAIKTQSCNTHSCKTCTVNLFNLSGYDNWECSCYGWPNQKQECDNIGGTWNGSSCTAAHNYGYMNFSSCKAISDTSVCETSDNNCDGYPG